MISNEPAQLDLLKKLQEATTEDVDEERGSFKKGDRVTYNMFGGGLTNSDIIRTLGINEHAMRANHNETIAEIVEAIGEKVARYGIMFEDGFIISDVAASELKSVKEKLYKGDEDIHVGATVTILYGGHKGEKGEILDFTLEGEDPDFEAEGGQVDVKLESGRTIYVPTFSVKVEESKTNEQKLSEVAVGDTVQLTHKKEIGYTIPGFAEGKVKQKLPDNRFLVHFEWRVSGKDLKQLANLGVDDIEKIGESKTNEAEEATDTMKPQEKPNIQAEDFHMEDLSDVDLEKAKGSSEESGNAIRQVKDDELKIEPDKVVTPKKESKLKEQEEDEMSFKEVKAETISAIKNMRKRTNEWSVRDSLKKFTSWGFWKKGEKALIDIETANEIADELLDYIQTTPQEQDVYDANDIVDHYTPRNESKLQEAKDVLVRITGGDDEGKAGLVTNWVKGLGYQDVSFEGKKKQISYEYLNVGDKSAKEYDKEVEVEESKVNEEETELTPSRAEMKKIGDEQLRTLHGRALKSQKYWDKDRTAPEKAELAKQAVKRYEEELVARGLITGVEIPNEKKESKYSFMKKQKPLWLCNECSKTFRSDESVCTLCESKEVEKIVEQGAGFTKEVFQVTWKNTDTGKEESTRVMAFDKADAKKEAQRSNREVTKVEGPITEEPGRAEESVPFDESAGEEFKPGTRVEEEETGKLGVVDTRRSDYEDNVYVLFDDEEQPVTVSASRLIKVKESKLHEDVQELVREVPGIDKEEQEILLKAIEDGTISNEWPTDEEMVDALTKAGVDSEIASDPEAEDFRVAYTKHILLTQAIKAARVAKESKIEEQEAEGVPEKGQTYSIHPTSGVNFPDGTYEVTSISYRWTAKGDLAKHFQIAGDDRWWIAKFYGFGGVKESEVEEAKEVKSIRTIEIVRSQLDPEAYNIRVVELPEGSIEMLDSVFDEKEAIKRGKEFARQLNAKFLGIIDEKKVNEKKCPKCGAEMMEEEDIEGFACAECGHVEESKLKEQEDDKARRKIELEKLGVAQLKDLWLKTVSPVPGFGKQPPKEKDILINHILGVEFRKKWESKLKEQKEGEFQKGYEYAQLTKEAHLNLKTVLDLIEPHSSDEFRRGYISYLEKFSDESKLKEQEEVKSFRVWYKDPSQAQLVKMKHEFRALTSQDAAKAARKLLDKEAPGNEFEIAKSELMGESKLKEQEEDVFTTVAKGIVDKVDADRLAKEKEGQVIQDPEDKDKFAILVKKEQ